VRNPFRVFIDPARRPRAIVWLGVALVATFALYGASMVATSSIWFCNDACHNVHADNKPTYFAGSHSEVSCMACHYPPSMDPAKFAFDRVDKLLDLYPTVAGTFEMPLNEYSHIALKTPSRYCTQCHAMKQRVMTPTTGRIIDHEVHEKAGITCAVCHNRVAHPETREYILPGNKHHEDFMTMRACFRCHTQTDTAPSEFKAAGACSTCHAPSFDLTPEDHKTAGKAWLEAVGGGESLHAKAAEEDAEAVKEAQSEWAAAEEHFFAREPRVIMRFIDVDTEKPLRVPPVATISACDTCHERETFCEPCHAEYKVPVGE